MDSSSATATTPRPIASGLGCPSAAGGGRAIGIQTTLDRYVNGTPLTLARWMLDGLDAADRVLLVCTTTYYRRFRGHEEPGKGKGVDWEGAVITQAIYDARSATTRFIPVLFDPAHAAQIPEPVRGHTFTA